ncbi:hypothetical protein HZ326_11153 [Fusarium oxysporum f. sp. albedinis]|nr:hypothetical protein HZ326_11153 [Fusarium oxysporum f. sp. albedinis]
MLCNLMRPQRFHFKPPVNLNPYKQFTRLSLGESTRSTLGSGPHGQSRESRDNRRTKPSPNSKCPGRVPA